jgi:hypothetical protein
VPLTVLYCEGNKQSIDTRVIRQLIPGECEVKPIGGKTSNSLASIISDRNLDPSLAGLFDRDFDCETKEIDEQPISCFHLNVDVGWTWERKEIENYLIDPGVVKRAGITGFRLETYQAILSEAAKSITIYSAARTALSCFTFVNYWGDNQTDAHLKGTYQFPRSPESRNKATCRTKIAEIVRKYKGDRIVEPENVLEKFDRILPDFQPGGVRFQNFLTFFAGKDLLAAMQQRLSDDLGYASKDTIKIFLERIINRLERENEVWEWLPEWKKLRQLCS